MSPPPRAGHVKDEAIHAPDHVDPLFPVIPPKISIFQPLVIQKDGSRSAKAHAVLRRVGGGFLIVPFEIDWLK
jgi:hypothetical protein